MIALALALQVITAPLDPSAVLPPPCPTPSSDTLTGTAGSAATCVPRQDAARPAGVQRAYATTDASGNWTVTFGRTFPVSPVVSVKPIMPSGKGDCGISAVSTTGASGSCWTYQSVVVSILGSTVNPIATAASGVAVMIVAGQPTQ